MTPEEHRKQAIIFADRAERSAANEDATAIVTAINGLTHATLAAIGAPIATVNVTPPQPSLEAKAVAKAVIRKAFHRTEAEG